MSDSDFSGRLPGPVTGRPRRPLSNSAVDRLLQHALLVVHDDLGRAEVEQSLQPVVAVDDATVQVVQVGGREAATVELHHRTQVRRDDRDGVEHHTGGVVVGRHEGRDDLQTLERTGLLLPAAGGDDLAQQLGLGIEVEGLETRWIAAAPM
jgi:hypothetical protein